MDPILKRDLVSLEPITLIELYCIDTTNIEANNLPEDEQIMYICNNTTEEYKPIYFNGVRYQPAPINFAGGELKGDGSQLARPTFTVTNFRGITARISMAANGLLGAKVTRTRIQLKNADLATWGSDPEFIPFWADPNPSRIVTKEEYLINSKQSENRSAIQFELVSPMDFQSLKLPKRPMYAMSCSFEYRNSTGCNYTGTPIATESNQLIYNIVPGSPINKGQWAPNTVYAVGNYVYLLSKNKDESGNFKKFFYVCSAAHTSIEGQKPYFLKDKWVNDACSKKVSGCSIRFAANRLPFGGFPSLTRKGYSE